jgi:ATP-dependent DNA ligase
LLRQVLGNVEAPRVVYVDHVVGNGTRLFEQVQEIGCEGIVSKRLGSRYWGGRSRDWLKTKCSQIGRSGEHSEALFSGRQKIGPDKKRGQTAEPDLIEGVQFGRGF